VPDVTGQVTFVSELRDRLFGAFEPVADDEAGASLLTGVAETATNFELVACNPNWFVWLFDKAPIIRMWTNDAQDKHYLQLVNTAASHPSRSTRRTARSTKP
jgi:hypothetical protein